MRHAHIIFLAFALALAAVGCTRENVTDCASVNVYVSMDPFDGEPQTKTSFDGTGFESGDLIRYKIMCPYSSAHENGERWSYYYSLTIPDTAGPWTIDSGTSYESQATTYVYTAQNSTGNRIFVVDGYRYVNPSNFFHADQSKLADYKASDVVWAQAIRQTGAREIHFNFKHKVAKLIATVDDSALGTALSNNSILTLEGMPDIDGAEIVVGDYYADESYEDYRFSYREKASCSYGNNGKVIGVQVIVETVGSSTVNRSRVYGMTGNPSPAGGSYNSDVWGTIANTATYTAYNGGSKVYYLYVPVCELTSNATFWLRDGSRRYSVTLDQKAFEEGKCYNVTLKFADPSNP